MKVKYEGPLAEVEIAAAGLSCKQGETVEVDDELGESLLEQEDNWQPAASGGKAKSAGNAAGDKETD